MFIIIVGMNDDSHNSSNLTSAFHHNDYATNTAASVTHRNDKSKIDSGKN